MKSRIPHQPVTPSGSRRFTSHDEPIRQTSGPSTVTVIGGSPEDIADLVAARLLEIQSQSNPAQSIGLPYPEFITRRQAAGLLQVDISTIARYINTGRLSCARPGVAESIAVSDLLPVYHEKFS